VLGPCDWDIPDPECCPRWDAASDAAKASAKDTAAFLLWAASGRQYGRCEAKLRPCRKRRGQSWPPRCGGTPLTARGWWAAAEGISGAWGGGRCGHPGHDCSCGKVCEVDLPGWFPEPVEVLLDGLVVPLHHFRVDSGRWLVWQEPCEPVCGCDVYGCFPDCQDLSVGPECAGTWQVTYRHGIPVPAAGLAAASELACEVLKACTGVGECRLPSNVRSISRQGVDIDFVNDGTVTSGGRLRFGIPTVDLWVAAVNPHGVSGPVQFYSPDVNRGRVTTWP
jgi:hypothetical protein